MSRARLIIIISAVVCTLVVAGVVVWWLVRPALDAETRARLEQMRAGALAIEAGNHGLVCERPLLRGESLDGPAGPDISSIGDLEGEIGECSELVRELRKEERSVHLADAPEDGQTYRRYKPYKDLDDPVWDSESFVSIEERCTVLAERIQRAVRHVDACSPYLQGERCFVHGHWALIELMDAIEIIVVRKIRRGETAEAFELMLDTMRFGDDLGRGGADWFAWSLGGVGRFKMTRLAQQVLDSDHVRLDPAMLEQVDRELALLVETAPHPFEGIRAMMISGWLTQWWKAFGEGDEDMPFAQACLEERPEEERAYDETMRLLAEKACGDDVLEPDPELVADELVWEWELLEKLDAACPAGTPPRTCWESMVTVAADHPDYTTLEGRTLETCQWSSEEGWHPMEYVGEARSGSSYLDMYEFWFFAHRRKQFLLQELRLLVAYRTMVERDGVCPAIDDFDEEPLAGLRDESTSGRKIHVDGSEPGVYFLQYDEEEWSEPQLMARCPAWAEWPLVANDGEVVGNPDNLYGIKGPCDSPDPHAPFGRCFMDDVWKASGSFVEKNPGRCPTIEQLKSLGFLVASAPTTDPWDRDFVIECSGDEVSVFSLGKDGTRGTPDDVPSSQTQDAAGSEDDEPEFTGKLSKWDIRDTLKAGMKAFEKCFGLIPEDAGKQEGVVSVEFVIGETGDVVSARVTDTTLGNVEVEHCILVRVKKVKFPAPEGGRVLVEYPFMVRRGE